MLINQYHFYYALVMKHILRQLFYKKDSNVGRATAVV